MIVILATHICSIKSYEVERSIFIHSPFSQTRFGPIMEFIKDDSNPVRQPVSLVRCSIGILLIRNQLSAIFDSFYHGCVLSLEFIRSHLIKFGDQLGRQGICTAHGAMVQNEKH